MRPQVRASAPKTTTTTTKIPQKLKTAGSGGAYLQPQLLTRMKQEDLEFKASLGNLSRPCLKFFF
jgi:hypothetical protein